MYGVVGVEDMVEEMYEMVEIKRVCDGVMANVLVF